MWDQSSVDEIKTFLSKLNQSNRFAIFLGSFVSVAKPTVFPSVTEFRSKTLQAIELSLKGRIRRKDFPIFKVLQTFQDHRSILGTRLSNIPFESFVGSLYQSHPSTIKSLMQELTYSPYSAPNFNHFGIVGLTLSLLQQGVSVILLTTNYDLAIENAFIKSGWKIGRSTFKGRHVKEIIFNCESGQVLFIKLHGSLECLESMVFTFDAVARCRADRHIKRAIVNLRGTNGMIFAGYSASDLHLRPLIESQLRQSGCTIFWAHYSEEKFREEVEKNTFRQEFFRRICIRFVQSNLLDPTNVFSVYNDKGKNIDKDSGLGAFDSVEKLSHCFDETPVPKLAEFLSLLTHRLHLPHSFGLLRNIPPSDRSLNLRLHSFGFVSQFNAGIRFGRAALPLVSDSWCLAMCSVWCAFYSTLRGIEAQHRKEILELHLTALFDFLKALLSVNWKMRQQRAVDRAECVHIWLHQLIRVAGVFLRGEPPNAQRRIRILLWNILRPLILITSRFNIWQHRRCGSLDHEAEMRREVLETFVFARIPPKETEEAEIKELFEQIESNNGLANLYMTMGRIRQACGQFEEAFEKFIQSLVYALRREDQSLVSKASGNGSRLAFFLAGDIMDPHAIDFESSEAMLTLRDLEDILKSWRRDRKHLDFRGRLLATYLGTLEPQKRPAALAALSSKRDPRVFPFFL